jgi:GTP-binding protein
MLPVVALVGRPNVGKSTLFNRLTGTRDALVADFPGLTRDRQYGQAKIDGHSFIVVDTGGLDGDENGIGSKMAAQSLQAIAESDVILFMVDGINGLTTGDEAIASYLRSNHSHVYLIVNKVDAIDSNTANNEFWRLGLKDVHQISAQQGRGVHALMRHIFAQESSNASENTESVWYDFSAEVDLQKTQILTEEEAEFSYQQLQDQPIKVSIIGRPNVGKSTLTNRFLGEERVVVFDMPGTTRDSIYIPFARDGREYVFIDTAGLTHYE